MNAAPKPGPVELLARIGLRRPDLVPPSALLVRDFAAEGECGGGLRDHRREMLGERSCEATS